ncbi:ABC transporter ATP-binding protein [Clostridia bacterium]|nr:ABC transporter ATP-binding protein [Clostridia bacterium]
MSENTKNTSNTIHNNSSNTSGKRAANPKDAILEIEHVNRTYYDTDGNTVEALKDVSLSVRRGEFISLIGSSGCGKTTLLRLIAGLDHPEAGTLRLNGTEINGTDPQRGYVFQQGSLFPWLTIYQNIASGLKARHVYKEQKAEVAKYIELIGLNGFEKVFPHQISGGMAQRVAIARALINKPEALLLDEPMGALDSFTRADIQDKLLELWRLYQTTMILVTHDVDEAIYLSDRIVIMTPRPGKISEILEVKLSHPRDRGGEEFLAIRKKILEKLHLANASQEPEYNL